MEKRKCLISEPFQVASVITAITVGAVLIITAIVCFANSFTDPRLISSVNGHGIILIDSSALDDVCGPPALKWRKGVRIYTESQKLCVERRIGRENHKRILDQEKQNVASWYKGFITTVLLVLYSAAVIWLAAYHDTVKEKAL